MLLSSWAALSSTFAGETRGHIFVETAERTYEPRENLARVSLRDVAAELTELPGADFTVKFRDGAERLQVHVRPRVYRGTLPRLIFCRVLADLGLWSKYDRIRRQHLVTRIPRDPRRHVPPADWSEETPEDGIRSGQAIAFGRHISRPYSVSRDDTVVRLNGIRIYPLTRRFTQERYRRSDRAKRQLLAVYQGQLSKADKDIALKKTIEWAKSDPDIITAGPGTAPSESTQHVPTITIRVRGFDYAESVALRTQDEAAAREHAAQRLTERRAKAIVQEVRDSLRRDQLVVCGYHEPIVYSRDVFEGVLRLLASPGDDLQKEVDLFQLLLLKGPVALLHLDIAMNFVGSYKE